MKIINFFLAFFVAHLLTACAGGQNIKNNKQLEGAGAVQGNNTVSALASEQNEANDLPIASNDFEYEGYYYCSQGKTKLKLSISDDFSNARFIFDTKKGVSGEFTMIRKKYNNENIVYFEGDQWVDRPKGYTTVDLKGTFSKDMNIFEGKIPSTKNCSYFKVKRNYSLNPDRKRDLEVILKTKNTEKEILLFIDQYKNSFHQDVLIKAQNKLKEKEDKNESNFDEFYMVRVIEEFETNDRNSSASGLTQSAVFSCKDITRVVEIRPIDPDKTRPAKTKIRWTLKRTYKPYAIKEKHDPIHVVRSYQIGPNTKFPIIDKIKYSCVYTSYRHHHATLSLIGKVFGFSPEESGISTTLKHYRFGFEIVENKWLNRF